MQKDRLTFNYGPVELAAPLTIAEMRLGPRQARHTWILV